MNSQRWFLEPLSLWLLFCAGLILLLGLLLCLLLATRHRTDRVPQALFFCVGGTVLVVTFAGAAWGTLIALEEPGLPSGQATTTAATLNGLALISLLATLIAALKTARGTLSLTGKFPFSPPFRRPIGRRQIGK